MATPSLPPHAGARLSTAILLSGLISLAAGCGVTGRCRVTVGNAGENVIKNVEVKSDDTVVWRATAIEPKATAPYGKLQNGLSKTTILKWKSKDDVALSKTVEAKKPVPPEYRGKIYFQIDALGNVKVFMTPDPDNESTDLPWAKPESWEGYPGIPGLTQ